MNTISLANKKCAPCEGNMAALDSNAVQALLDGLGAGWAINDAGHLYKKYSLSDFMGPMALANQIAELAEQEGHHPDLTIRWGICAVEIWTHAVHGLTENDFILAAKIDGLVPKNKA